MGRGQKQQEEGEETFPRLKNSSQNLLQKEVTKRTDKQVKTLEGVILVGDSNMRGLKLLLLDRLNWDCRVKVTALSGVKMQGIMEAAVIRRPQTPEWPQQCSE